MLFVQSTEVKYSGTAGAWYYQQAGPSASTEVPANEKAELRGNHEIIHVLGGFSRDPKTSIMVARKTVFFNYGFSAVIRSNSAAIKFMLLPAKSLRG